MQSRIPLLGLAIIFTLAPVLRTEIAVFEQFEYSDGTVAGQGEKEQNGWVAEWDGEGLTQNDRALVGSGYASRRMIRRVAFEPDGEWLFHATMQRGGVAHVPLGHGPRESERILATGFATLDKTISGDAAHKFVGDINGEALDLFVGDGPGLLYT